MFGSWLQSYANSPNKTKYQHLKSKTIMATNIAGIPPQGTPLPSRGGVGVGSLTFFAEKTQPIKDVHNKQILRRFSLLVL
jgi:hypothetical protein